MCTHLKNGASWFLPFDKGWNDGAGNPPNPDGHRHGLSLERDTLPKGSLTNIIENFAQIVEEKDEKTGRKKREAGFPTVSPSQRRSQTPCRNRTRPRAGDF